MRVNVARLKQDLGALGAVGRTPEGGVSRPSWSAADLQARRWLMERITAEGMQARMDAAGNIFGRWQSGGPVVMVGSHIDSVPNGGMFDGALGVLAGLECLRRIKEEGVRLRYPLELVAFTDEEGAFGGFFGSYAFTGALKPGEIPNIRDSKGLRILEAMARHGMDALQAPQARRNPQEIRAYVELTSSRGRSWRAGESPSAWSRPSWGFAATALRSADAPIMRARPRCWIGGTPSWGRPIWS